MEQQQQSLISGAVSNGQLPDDSYIEKLFPKCPAKQLQQSRANNFQQNRSSFRQNGNRLQQKRQHRAKARHNYHQQQQQQQQQQQHQQQQQQQQQFQQRPTGQETLLDAASSSTQPIASSAPAGRNKMDKSGHSDASKRALDWYDSSSDSLDSKEPGAKSGYTYASGLKRATSNHGALDATNSGGQQQTSEANTCQAGESGRTRQKTRKYTASKNLQKQLRRSQSGYKLEPRPPPVDASIQTRRIDADEQPNLPLSSGQPGLAEQQANTNGKSPPLVRSSAHSGPGNQARASGKPVSRTCRGIVFSEPLAVTNLGPSEQIQPSTECSQNEAGDDNLAPNEQCGGEQAQQVCLLARRLARKVDIRSADFVVPPVASRKSEVAKQGQQDRQQPALYISTIESAGIFETSAQEYPRHTTAQQTHEPTVSVPVVKSRLPRPPVNPHDDLAKDDDKYINLFVYDNTIPQSHLIDEEKEIGVKEEEEEEKDNDQERLVLNKLIKAHPESLDLPGKQIEQVASNLSFGKYEDRHELLTEDLSENERDVIRNDTSVEELCGLNEENEITDVNRRGSNTHNNDHTISDEFEQRPEQVSINTTATATTNPLSSTSKLTHTTGKLNRPIGSLQTVDEKGEISSDEDVSQPELQASSNPAGLIDISENDATMLDEDNIKLLKKSGLAPPGFPRRVRPNAGRPEASPISQTAVPSTVGETHHLSPTDAHASLSVHTRGESEQPIEQQSVVGSVTSAVQGTTSELATNRILLANQGSGKLNHSESGLQEAMSKLVLDTGNLAGEPVPSGTLQRQHHKLPNETSHYSIARSISKPPVHSSADFTMLSELPPSSRLQFNTLSEAESEPDTQQTSMEPVASTSGRVARCKATPEREPTEQFSGPVRRTSVSQANGSLADDDQAPAARTALVFPRLDEGISSEAESCDEEADEEDDRAMEADVDADDDEDEDEDGDEDEDEDADGPAATLTTVDRGHSIHSNIDPFLRLNQQHRPQNCLIGTLQQQHQQQPPHVTSTSLPTSEAHHQMKQSSGSSPYASFNIQGAGEVLDQSDIKSIPNYANQNGQTASYWPGATNQPALSTQPPTSQPQFSIQRNHGNTNNGNNINTTRPNNYANRDEAKSVNRLSSDTDNETDRLLGTQRNDQLQKMNHNELVSNNSSSERSGVNSFAGRHSNSREVLIEGVLFGVKYLGSTHTECEGRGEKEDRIHQAEMAVHEVKFRNGDSQLPAEVQLFISTEKIMVLDDKHRKIMMDHSLRTISYIADIGDAIVLIVRKKSASLDAANELGGRSVAKTSCHVFESNESHTITKSISQAFQVAYTELLKANGTSDSNSYLPKELDYQEVLNSQEMSMTELEMFARKDNQREVIVPKKEGEILGLSIVESGWGSVLPTAVIAGLKQDGPAYRCKKLSVGDQILSINGISLVGLSLADCQKILRKTKDQSVARLSVVPCPITVEVKIKRPDTKYQLGFSVQHGVICSLLRGGIAERGGVRVGHRIISINGTTVVGVPHDKIVTLLASSVGEIRMKTCLTSLYRHMLGEEKNVSFV